MLILSTAFFLGLPYHPIEPLPPNIVDIHCHVAGIGAGNSGCFISPKLRANWRFKIYLKSFGVTEKEILEKGDDLVPDRISSLLARSRFVQKAVLLALDGVVDEKGSLDIGRTEIYVPNEFVATASTRHANLLFGASVNPYRKDALQRLTWAKAQGAVLVKWIPSIMEIDPGDMQLVPFYRKLVELNLPLLTHTGKEQSFSRSRDELCDPEKLRLPLSLGVTVVAAHLASIGEYQGERSSVRLVRLMGTYPNLLSDVSSLTQINKLLYLKDAIEIEQSSGRLLYGSDFPLINTALVSPWYYLARLSPKQLIRISRTENPWDADVLLKQQLGMPAAVFARPGQWLQE